MGDAKKHPRSQHRGALPELRCARRGVCRSQVRRQDGQGRQTRSTWRFGTQVVVGGPDHESWLTCLSVQLRGFEQVRAIYMEPEPFSEANNLMTPSMKIRRNEVQCCVTSDVARLIRGRHPCMVGEKALPKSHRHPLRDHAFHCLATNHGEMIGSPFVQRLFHILSSRFVHN